MLHRTPLRNQRSPECHFFNVHPARGHAEGEGINTEGCKMQCSRPPAWEGRGIPVDLGFLHLQTGARHTLSQEALKGRLFLPRKRKSLSCPDLRLGWRLLSARGRQIPRPRHEGPLPPSRGRHRSPKGSLPKRGHTYRGVLREPHPLKSWIPCSFHPFLHLGLLNGHCVFSPRR